MLKQTFFRLSFIYLDIQSWTSDLSVSVLVRRRSPDIHVKSAHPKGVSQRSLRLELSQPPGFYSKCADTLPAENRRGSVPCQTPGGRVLTREERRPERSLCGAARKTLAE